MIGKRFGRLTVTAVEGPRKGLWRCKCDCGVEVLRLRSHVKSGHATSCGCAKAETQGIIAVWTASHGHAKKGRHTPTYQTWRAMWTRCTNPNQKQWKDYGGRGITVDPRWKDFNVFLVDMGERPSGLTLDRMDNTKGYYKENCKWSTRAEQRRNSSHITPITIHGVTKYSWEWAEHLGIPLRKIRSRWAKLREGRITEDQFIEMRGGK